MIWLQMESALCWLGFLKHVVTWSPASWLQRKQWERVWPVLNCSILNSTKLHQQRELEVKLPEILC